MRMKKVGQWILQHIFTGYLLLLKKTVTIQWQEDTQYGASQIFGNTGT